MSNFLFLAQIIVSVSVAFVWIFRYDVIIAEFKQFGLSDLTRTFVGASKIALATLLVVGILYPTLVFIPSMLMGVFMLAAQYFHFKINNPFIKHLPSLVFLLLCAFMTFATYNIV
jgi:DoxX-like family